MDRQSKLDLEDREQMIASLRKKLADKEQEINVNLSPEMFMPSSVCCWQKLRDRDIAKEAKISQLSLKSRESDQESRSEYSAARAPSNVSLRLEMQKKDDVSSSVAFSLSLRSLQFLVSANWGS